MRKNIVITLVCCCTLVTACASNQNTPNPSTSEHPAKISKRACQSHHFLTKYQCSINKIEHAAKSGNANAAYALGYLYYYGIGLKADQQSARLWIERAANLGQAQALQAKAMLSTQSHPSSSTIPVMQYHNVSANNQNPAGKNKPVRHPSALPPQKQQTTVRHPDALRNQNTPRYTKAYTIQLAASHHADRLRQFIKKYRVQQAHIVTSRRDGQRWFILTSGHYASKQTAKQSLQQFPAKLKAMGAWVRSTKQLQG